MPGSFYKITRRCTQRQFLLRPDEVTNNVFAYCLGEAADRFDIDVMMTSAESNHHHTDIFDAHGNVIPFVERFHKLVAKGARTRIEVGGRTSGPPRHRASFGSRIRSR